MTTHRNTSQDFSTINNNLPDDTIIKLNQNQIQDSARVLGQAFIQDPFLSYFLPEKHQQRIDAVEWISRTVLCYYQRSEEIYITNNCIKGVAVWTPPEHSSDSILHWLQAGLIALPQKIGVRKMVEFLSANQKVDEYHRKIMKKPHWYLKMLGVSPDFQNQGVGQKLLQPVLNRADKEGFPCYLETSTPSGVRFYQRQGFVVVDSDKLLQDSRQLWFMKREPQSDYSNPK
ncbi:GNAT family N-acetyltransferase [Calothrix sp. FACHB-1219]|uniref:GNAT family N-acetyltransferase n=1 Tax=unclassified Calothrix TaxID=2619626 RepID=UPI00168A0C9B|nr:MULTISPECIES: GNAT family N-acetyltransferase [unclassified Calothrix]MBD2202042.1 GNAT family N-acetyltransferase [Calothrix sp. FACHB-168]MBD2217078.1 GNAT family N-acetyltransferase [Calothrix sp. FACHB-1219]